VFSVNSVVTLLFLGVNRLKRRLSILFIIILFVSVYPVLSADVYDLTGVKADETIKKIIKNDIFKWIDDAVIVRALKDANSINAKRTLQTIKMLDNEWQNDKGLNEIMKKYLSCEAAMFLKKKEKNSNGVYDEISLSDRQGCITAMTNKTFDFWQGDEDKFVKAFNNGKGAIYVSEKTLDKSTMDELVQISVPVYDPATKEAIGVLTIGVNNDRF
jgi:hypothetical protein